MFGLPKVQETPERASDSAKWQRFTPEGLPFRSSLVFLHVDAIESSGVTVERSL